MCCLEKLIEKWFRKKLDSRRIEKYLQEINLKKRGEGVIQKSPLVNPRVYCVERRIKPVRSIEEYIDILKHFIAQASKEDSVLIVFPEYNFFDLLGLIPGFRILNNYLNQKAKKIKGNFENSSRKEHSEGINPLFIHILKGIAKPVEEGTKMIFSSLAKTYQLYIYTGTYILKEEEKIFNAGFLYGPQGELIGIQKKIHLTDFEEGLGLKRGEKLEVYNLPWGKVVCPICMDATYFETFRIAREKGAEIVILPIANLEEYNPWKALRGIWPRVQESILYGLKSSLNGWIAGMHFTGKAGIFAPWTLTPRQDGVIAISSHYEGDFLISGQINITRLYEVRKDTEYLEDINIEFEMGYLEKTYESVKLVKNKN
ncbi:MAG: hypothetical protein Kow00103_07760 [Candidatus Caldatribacteriota bacterium]